MEYQHTYILTRVIFVRQSQSYVNSYTEDVAPESGAIIPAEYSPSGKALLLAAYEKSNTIAVFELTVE